MSVQENLRPKARHILHNISKYIHIELLGNTINLNYTEESVKRLAAELEEIHSDGYTAAILSSAHYNTEV